MNKLADLMERDRAYLMQLESLDNGEFSLFLFAVLAKFAFHRSI
jgi:hypothetical protein